MKKNSNSQHELKVVELFAGVGGFRLGLDAAGNSEIAFNTIWSNQWEPGRKRQVASEIYLKRFFEDKGIDYKNRVRKVKATSETPEKEIRYAESDGGLAHVCGDISAIDVDEIPEHDLLVGGFPCQDYSVAKTLNQADGIVGKKGVLWWEIHRILRDAEKRPSMLLLENVDRLLKSPATQRGRDFAIILASLADLGYAVEWRVINAADYGMPQRRRRVFILGILEGTEVYENMLESNKFECLYSSGLLATAFPVLPPNENPLDMPDLNIAGELPYISEHFPHPTKAVASPFLKAGIMVERMVWTRDVTPDYRGKRVTLGEVLEPDSKVPPEYFIEESDIPKWEAHKSAKSERRENKNGHKYFYSEGSMRFPDPLEDASRTIVTGEGGRSPSRFKHAVKAGNGKLRRLLPIELERLNCFPHDHTKADGVSDTQRAFLMGNALVVEIVERIGVEILERLSQQSESLKKAA
ncbi:MAG: DNA (cytosine-5-)-methyltransferase [Aridibacter famidurans]|nr:DNA (cytosine-5-)-methyltransferase [Aridibacter famidurans]